MTFKRAISMALAPLSLAAATIVGVGVPASAAETAAAYTCITRFSAPATPTGWRQTPWSRAGQTNRCLMEPGARHVGVEALQNSLKFCYGYNIAVDGIYGTNTKAALAGAQRQHGIADDGVYGPVTARNIVFAALKYNPDRHRDELVNCRKWNP